MGKINKNLKLTLFTIVISVLFMIPGIVKAEEEYQVCDMNGDCEFLPEGTIITLPSINDVPEAPDSEIRAFIFDGELVNVTIYYEFLGFKLDDNDAFIRAPGSEVVVNANFMINPWYGAYYDNSTLPENPTNDGYEFIGWYTYPIGGVKYDFNKPYINYYYYALEDSNIGAVQLYSQWQEIESDEVLVTWDNEIFIYDSGTTVDLDIEKSREYDDVIANVSLQWNRNPYIDRNEYITNHYTRSGYLINGVSHSATGTYTFNENTTIVSQYTSELIYPDISQYDYKGFLGFQEPSTGETITSLEGQEKYCINQVWEGTGVPFYCSLNYTAVWDDNSGGESEFVHVFYKSEEYYGLIEDVYENELVVEAGTPITIEVPEVITKTLTLNLVYGLGLPIMPVHFTFTYIPASNVNITTEEGTDFGQLGDVIVVNKDTKIDVSYYPQVTSDFVGYSSYDWDVGAYIYDSSGIQYYLQSWFTKYSPWSIPCHGHGCLATNETGETNGIELSSFGYKEEMDNSYVYASYSMADWLPLEVHDSVSDDNYSAIYFQTGDAFGNLSINVTEHEGYIFDNFYRQDDYEEVMPDDEILYNALFVFARYIEDTRNNNNECIIVTPDNTTTIINKGSTYQLGVNNNIKADDHIAEVTFKYNDETGDVESDYVTRSYTPNGWLINDVVYSDNQTFTCNADLAVIHPNYTITNNSPVFPEPEQKEHYSFDGWYDAPYYGTEYTEYDHKPDKVLFAHWIGDNISLTKPNNKVVTMHYGDTYDLGTNNIIKADDVTTITFKYQDGVTADTEENITVSYTPDGWKVNSVETVNDTVLTLTENTVVQYNYTSSSNEISFPVPDEREHYTFLGWYDEEENGELVENYSGSEDLVLYAYWLGDEINVTLPDNTIEVHHYGDTYELGTNDVAKANSNGALITYKYNDGVTADGTDHVVISYTPAGWLVNDVVTSDETNLTLTEPITIDYNYTEAKASPEFPEPTRENYTFLGWYDLEENGELVESYTGDDDLILYAYWNLDKPTDFELDSYSLNLVVGDNHQVEVTFDPDGTEDTLVYSGYNDEIISITTGGLITALSSGETTITVALESDNTVTKEISVSVMGDKITSSTLDVIDKVTYQIIIGEEPNTKIETILEKIDNSEYIRIYTKNDELVDPNDYDTELIKTGMKMKLVINEVEKDEVIVVIRGDVDGDGLVNVTDLAPVEWHILEDERDYLEGYYKDAVDLDGDGIVDVRDEGKLLLFILEDESVPTLND